MHLEISTKENFSSTMNASMANHIKDLYSRLSLCKGISLYDIKVQTNSIDKRKKKNLSQTNGGFWDIPSIFRYGKEDFTHWVFGCIEKKKILRSHIHDVWVNFTGKYYSYDFFTGVRPANERCNRINSVRPLVYCDPRQPLIVLLLCVKVFTERRLKAWTCIKYIYFFSGVERDFWTSQRELSNQQLFWSIVCLRRVDSY